MNMKYVKTAMLGLMGLAYIGAGANHFAKPDFYLAMMPAYLPWHAALVWLSGLAEIALGVGVLIPRTRRLAAWGVIGLLIAVFPANLNMALHPDAFPDAPRIALYIRLPMQLVLIAWAYWFTHGAKADDADHSASSASSAES